MQRAEVMRIEIDVEPPLDTGPTPVGELRVVPFRGGRFEGPGLRGRLLPGGTDWQQVRGDGVLEIRARYMLETDVGETIQVVSEGLRSASPEVLARLGAGEEVPPDAYYFRTFVRLTTAAGCLARFNHRLFIGVGVRRARQVRITVYEVP
jgi:hypothetical protein